MHGKITKITRTDGSLIALEPELSCVLTDQRLTFSVALPFVIMLCYPKGEPVETQAELLRLDFEVQINNGQRYIFSNWFLSSKETASLCLDAKSHPDQNGGFGNRASP